MERLTLTAILCVSSLKSKCFPYSDRTKPYPHTVVISVQIPSFPIKNLNDWNECWTTRLPQMSVNDTSVLQHEQTFRFFFFCQHYSWVVLWSDQSLTLSEMSDWLQADLGAVCIVWQLVMGCWSTKPHLVPAVFALLVTYKRIAPHSATLLPFLTHTNSRPTHLLHILYIHTCHPSLVIYTDTPPAFLPTRLLRLSWLPCCLSVVTDECVSSISFRLGAHF